MSISELRALLEVLTEFKVTHYKNGELALVMEQPATDDAESTNAIGFAVETESDEDEPAEDPFASVRGKLNPAYFDPRLGLVK